MFVQEKQVIPHISGTRFVMIHEENDLRFLGIAWNNGNPYTFISTCGSTMNASPYVISVYDDNGKRRKLGFARPRVIDTYQMAAGVIDQHNQLRQGDLALEKVWVTQNWAFRIITTVIGICVVDTYCACIWMTSDESVKNLGQTRFVSRLAAQLIEQGKKMMMGQVPIAAPSTPTVQAVSLWDHSVRSTNI